MIKYPDNVKTEQGYQINKIKSNQTKNIIQFDEGNVAERSRNKIQQTDFLNYQSRHGNTIKNLQKSIKKLKYETNCDKNKALP